MELSGEIQLSATADEIWKTLNDPVALQRCIPGCTAIDRKDSNTFLTTIRIKIGPVNTQFSTLLTVIPVAPPTRYSLTGEGQGGSSGFAKGTVNIELKANAAGTLLGYRSQILIGGKVAQVGSRLLTATAKKWVRQFFDTLAAVINED
ncbi:MAG TPA: carbon monoxide dehydrogenase [Gammaproteobacteria bacterium]|jgi:carbon monoxide dehydrogenase subunit G|nr:carbon monoxide dehydrogenase subunit G [Gammaproteobacteria bacterium]RTZ66896.1 MAG: carbon monoxide dehydrogenase [Gammaproteobacteria bacterium]HAN59705.1 carbon monoxide dehydrogenase [Gammaproteobacteria bacterium]HHZ72658.1 carbon monoxide dehydrogenase [Gammaproteobacteria bacterium]HIA41157.1 carbon monoxide dehydrogenase [Gammaproteobacteria bacterium]|tara:strand:+ start:1720 stop:2163 length:444 start_codon:yes stop_codon:yes gene_type:complete